ncbi:MAG: c-type cytochrome [Pseudorhodobacter sp.]|nr:c-type cytochrome [Pseudorhodobacter sp.]
MQPGFPMKMIASLGLIGAVGACELPQPGAQAPTGAEDFATFCVSCHGPGGVGDGPVAAGLPKAPADLTAISARNGGTFPQAQVMSKIWGYARQNGQVMPAFAPLLEGDTVLFDSGDGIATPTPLRLVQLMEYLEGL